MSPGVAGNVHRADPHRRRRSRAPAGGGGLRTAAFLVDGGEWQWLPEQFEASSLSDEAGPLTAPNFTGTLVGMRCQDSAGTEYPADFDYFEYREREFSAALLP